EGYEPFLQDIPLPTPNAHRDVRATLVRARANAYAMLQVSTTPAGAHAVVDGREVPGTTPLMVPELQPDVEHTVLVRQPDYEEETFTFVGHRGVVENRAFVLRERPLGPGEAFLRIVTEPPGAHVRVGDREFTSGSPYRVRVP